MLDFSEKTIRKDCPHCNLGSFALEHPLEETENFQVVCDVHPLVEGHILIIPKQHISCVGEYDSELFDEFVELYDKFSGFLKKEYGAVSAFEHGKIGQTVFHSHVHLLPFKDEAGEIVAEDKLTRIRNLSDLKGVFEREGKYLFFSIGDELWTVDFALGEPRFFRDRFARALGSPKRGNWKKMHSDKKIMSIADEEIMRFEKRWKKYPAA